MLTLPSLFTRGKKAGQAQARQAMSLKALQKIIITVELPGTLPKFFPRHRPGAVLQTKVERKTYPYRELPGTSWWF